MADSETNALVDVPRIPVGDWVDTIVDWLQDNIAPFFDFVQYVGEAAVEGLTTALLWPPPLVLALVLALVGLLVRSWRFALVSAVALVLVISMELWVEAMQTLSLILVATVIAAAIAVPIGIAAARSDRVSAVVKPVLDLMQTMPAFVYLVPAVTFFSIGVVPGVVATIIFALPPGVRLTELGIRQVDSEIVEAGQAFGSSPSQILRGIQLPLALPTVMAGINQVIMLALSMAVIAGLVGAGGLGQVVTTSISRLDVGLGFEAGISVVILAIFLDRLTAALGQREERRGRFRSMLDRGRTTTRTAGRPEEQDSSDAREGADREPTPV